MALNKILVVTSTLPASPDDPVPAFVSDQVSALKRLHPEVAFHVLAPHNAYAKTEKYTERADFTEYRFHYFLPRWELLTGRTIMAALKAHKLLYFVIPFLFLFETIATWRLARRLKPDLIYVHWFTPQAVTAMPASRFLKIPLVFTTHASDVAVWKMIPGGAKIVRLVCKHTVSFSAVSEQTAARLRAFWPSSGQLRKELDDKLSIIPMGTELSAGIPKKPARDKYPDKLVVTFIGRLVERKGVADLITAFQQADLPNAQLVIAGDGQDRARFEKLAAPLGSSCAFVGYVAGSVKDNLLARTDILVLPSVSDDKNAEGLPVVFMEGIAAGKIVIASDTTGAQESLTNGKDGYIFAQHDVDELVKLLRTAAELTPSKRASIQTAARALADNFSWPKVAADQYTVLKDAYDTFHTNHA